MKIESRKYISISKTVEYLSELMLQQSFLKFMQLQGVTQLLFYMVLGKSKFLKMSKWQRKTQVSKGNWFFHVEKFIQTVCYSGKKEDSLTEIRVRLYRQMNVKTSQSFLLPDEKSMLQAIKSINCKIYCCSTVDETIVSGILLQNNVCIVDNKNEEVRPLWFTGMFLISCFHFHSNQQI